MGSEVKNKAPIPLTQQRGIESISSNISHSMSSREATTRLGSTEKTASPTSNISPRRSDRRIMPTREVALSTASIRTSENTFSDFPRSISVTVNQRLAIFHCENFENASDEEDTFFRHLFFKMWAEAKILTLEGKGSRDRAYRAFVDAMIAIGCEVN